MQYCINALLKNNNEIMQYYIINNDIALIMHYHALLQMPDLYALQDLPKNDSRILKIIHNSMYGASKLMIRHSPNNHQFLHFLQKGGTLR